MIRSAFFTCCLLATITSPPSAQLVFSGRVIDESSGLAVEGARLVLLDRSENQLAVGSTNRRGVFDFQIGRKVVEAAVLLRIERIGYQEMLLSLVGRRQELTALEIRLPPVSIALDPLEVVGRRGSPVLDAFEKRRAGGTGRYFTREDVSRLQPQYVTDLLATLPGVRFLSSGRGARRVVSFGHAPGSPDCPAQIFVDGRPLNRRTARAPAGADAPTIDDVVTPNVIEGIEVYRGVATVPPEFLSPDAVCGVVAIWTRRGRSPF
jgi:hypothetical protein